MTERLSGRDKYLAEELLEHQYHTTFILFSDGEPFGGINDEERAIAECQRLNAKGLDVELYEFNLRPNCSIDWQSRKKVVETLG